MNSKKVHEIVARCLSLIPLIREHQGISLRELSQLARTPEKQIAEELSQVMLMCGVPPYFPHDYIAFALHGDRVSIQFADQFRRPISLNPLEALSLKVACESLSPPGRAAPRAMAALLRKVESAMSPEQRRQFRNLSKRTVLAESEDEASLVASRAALAVSQRRVLRLDYQAAGRVGSRERLVEPYGLLHREGRWYIVGHDRSRGQVVHFREDRVQQIHLTEEVFEIPSDFRLTEHAVFDGPEDDGDRARARVRFTGPSARWMREMSPPGQLKEVTFGVVEWQPAIGSSSGLLNFILGFGEEACLEEPADLREQAIRSLRAVIAVHEGSP
ncbi:MAG TPA: WYL domain-containing protein [Planctomycetota bacterium]|jgi:predicted DNA-binding transcriptional regulator YafY|nr:WYL domain-containing protein [Planctomycetota bacterium]